MPELFELKAVYIQDSDCHKDNDFTQELEITAQGVPPDFFYTIKTERWAFDNIGEIVAVISDFMKRCENTKVSRLKTTSSRSQENDNKLKQG